jgi:hypothetical protein
MALSHGTLKNELQKGFKRPTPSARDAAQIISLAFDNYIKRAMNSGQQSYISCGGISTLRSALEKTFKSQLSSKSQVAQEISSAFNTCVKTLLTLYQHGPPDTSVSFVGFKQKNQKLFNSLTPSPDMFALEFALNIHAFVTKTIVSGAIPSSPPIPFSGPLT